MRLRQAVGSESNAGTKRLIYFGLLTVGPAADTGFWPSAICFLRMLNRPSIARGVRFNFAAIEIEDFAGGPHFKQPEIVSFGPFPLLIPDHGRRRCECAEG